MPSPRLLKGRFSRVGHVYSITTVTHGRRALFAIPLRAEIVSDQIPEADRSGRTHTLAWVLMPDHLHWLFRLESGNLSAAVHWLKMRSAQAINRKESRQGRLWQDGFHDRCIRDQHELHRHACYIVENPIRSGLCHRIEDHPHWWCAWIRSSQDLG
jgi:REP element-mobilizing transposase RayT